MNKEDIQLNSKLSPRLEFRVPRALKPYANNARTHSKKQLKLIADSIKRFGFTNPILLSDEDEIIAGHGRVMAAINLNMDQVPVIRLSHLSEAERRAYVLADNRLAEHAGWDQDILTIELQALMEMDFDLSITGFEIAEIDMVFEATSDGTAHQADALPSSGGPYVTQRGDVWHLGPHRLLCGDALIEEDIAFLVNNHTMDLMFTNPPYNVAIDGHVCGSGSVTHKEFAFASGEMDEAQFTAFLATSLNLASSVCRDGAIAYVCTDWRHIGELLAAAKSAFTELKNLCVWNKTNGGMGTFYRSKHELVFVFKIGTAPHVNSFGLGETGRYRTNVWDYAGVNVPTAEAKTALEVHPTVKPVAMVVDAIKDCSKRGGRILDTFGGSGTTLIAAQTCGRIAHLLEYEPAYCDVTLKRYIKMTGDQPVHVASGEVFEERQSDARFAAKAEVQK